MPLPTLTNDIHIFEDGNDDIESSFEQNCGGSFDDSVVSGLSKDTAQTSDIDASLCILHSSSEDSGDEMFSSKVKEEDGSATCPDGCNDKELMKFSAIEYIKSFKRKLRKAEKKNRKLQETNKELKEGMTNKDVTYKLLVKSQIETKELRHKVQELEHDIDRLNLKQRLTAQALTNQKDLATKTIQKEKVTNQEYVIKIVKLAKENAVLKKKQMDMEVQNEEVLAKLVQENERLKQQLQRQQQQLAAQN